MLTCAMERVGATPSCCSGKLKTSSKPRRKDSKAVSNVLKSLMEIPASLKLGTLAIKYVELDEIRMKCEVSIAGLEKHCVNLQTELDQVKEENARQLLARNHLEKLCRELYRLNKTVREDSATRIREEEERRQEVTTKFETTLNEVTNMMQENTLKNEKLRDDNLNMAGKMKVLYEEFESRKEEQVRLDQQLDLEHQLTQVQIEKAKLEMQAERTLWDEERTSLTEKWKSSENSCSELQFVVEELQKRMETYEELHRGYKTAIDNNSKFFENCKAEINSMSKKVALLDKEIIVWKERSQQNALKAMDISIVKQAQETQLTSALKRVDSLQSLCRQLQGDRASYLKILQAKGIDPDSEICSIKEEMKPSQKELLLKPIWAQLNVIKPKCASKKDEMSFNALQNLIENSKSRDTVNSTINLILGFINVKGNKKSFTGKSVNCIPPSCIVDGNTANFENPNFSINGSSCSDLE